MQPNRNNHGRIRGRKGVELRKARLSRSNGLCEHCLTRDRVALATEVDHIKPLAFGGLDVDENTRNLCSDCHAKATAEQFGLKAPKRRIGLDGWAVEE